MDRPSSQSRYSKTSFKQSIKGDNYTIPKIRYEYDEVSLETFMGNKYDGFITVRSSIIPYVIVNDEIYWILGSFHDYPRDILMDFGGRCLISSQHERKNYQHQFGCAMLELNEESKGLLVKPVLASMGTNEIFIYRGRDNYHKEYVWFVMVQLDYDEVKPLVDRFESTLYVHEGEKLGPLGFYKESDIISNNHRTSSNLTDFINYYRTLKSD